MIAGVPMTDPIEREAAIAAVELRATMEVKLQGSTYDYTVRPVAYVTDVVDALRALPFARVGGGEDTRQRQHASDCAVYNRPYTEAGPCDCGAGRFNVPESGEPPECRWCGKVCVTDKCQACGGLQAATKPVVDPAVFDMAHGLAPRGEPDENYADVEFVKALDEYVRFRDDVLYDEGIEGDSKLDAAHIDVLRQRVLDLYRAAAPVALKGEKS